jgi:hypothetical protein
MLNPNSDSLDAEVHRALAAGDFETARQLSRALGQAIMREASATPQSDRAALVQRRLSRLREHLSLARVLRAHIASHLQANAAAYLYRAISTSAHSWRFEG